MQKFIHPPLSPVSSAVHSVKVPGFLSVLFFFILHSAFLHARDADIYEEMPARSTFKTDDYSFQMHLAAGVDVSLRIREVPKKNDPPADPANPPPEREKIEREFREDIVRVRRSIGSIKMPDAFFVDGWCLIDDPRRGFTIKRPIFGSILLEPMTAYSFPELVWADKKTRWVNPNAKDEERKIEIYKQGDRVLEVDAATHRPVRFRDGDSVWTYSYRESTTPVVLPPGLQDALRRATS